MTVWRSLPTHPARQVLQLHRYHLALSVDDTFNISSCANWALFNVIVVDEHGKSVLVAQALLGTKTTASYVWFFRCLKKQMRHHPDIIISDGDLAIAAAIREELPNTHHCFCVWHTLYPTSWHTLYPTSWHTLYPTSWHTLYPTSWHTLYPTSWHTLYPTSWHTLCTPS